MFKKLVLLFLISSPLLAQVSINMPGTVLQSNIMRPGFVLGGVTEYGQGQMLRSLNYANLGYVNPVIYRQSFECSNGGTNSTTAWYASVTGDYPTNFWAGATATWEKQTGATPESSTVLTSTANSGGGFQFTFPTGSPFSNACTAGTNTSNTDILILRQDNPPAGALAASTVYSNSHVSYSTDTNPSSTNTVRSLAITSGNSINFYIDQQFSGWAPNTSSPHPVVWKLFNGVYALTVGAKCDTTGATGTVTSNFTRGSTSATFNHAITGNSTLRSGWQSFSDNATFNETYASAPTATGQLTFTATCSTGNAILSDMDMIEASTYPGNTTMFTDAVFRALKNLNPGVLRLMYPTSWCSNPVAQMNAVGMIPACGISGAQIEKINVSIPYRWYLDLTKALGTEPWTTVGNFTTGSELASYINLLGTSGYISYFAGLNQHINIEHGNEAFNEGAAGQQDTGNGLGYGSIIGPVMTAARGASSYTATIRLIANSFFSGSQASNPGSGSWGWNVLHAAGCTTANKTTPQTQCPDAMSIATYKLNNLSDLTDPYINEVTEGQNQDSIACNYTTCNHPSVPAVVQFLATYGLVPYIYEGGQGIVTGSAAPTQTQTNGISSGLLMAQNTIHNYLMDIRDAGVYGPKNIFAFTDSPYTGTINSTSQLSWVSQAYMACGPGNINSGCVDIPYADAIWAGGVNTAMAGKTNLVSVTQSGQPTSNQPISQAGTIAANTSVNLTDPFSFEDSAGNVTLIVFNDQESTSQVFNFSGAHAPVGHSVTKAYYTSPNVLDNNAASVIGNNPSAVVTAPTPTVVSGGLSTDTIPAHSMGVYTYNINSTPTTPVSFTITGTFKITCTGSCKITN